jgi:hypothetical protein
MKAIVTMRKEERRGDEKNEVRFWVGVNVFIFPPRRALLRLFLVMLVHNYSEFYGSKQFNYARGRK